MPRTSNPLANLFQAMGQCSTTPAEQQQQQQQQQSHAQYASNNHNGTAETSSHGSRSDRSRHASKASSRSYHTAHTSSQQHQAQARDDSDAHMSDANAAGASDNARRRSSSAGHNVAAMVANARHANKQFDPYMAQQQQQQEQQRRSRSRSTSRRRASPSPHRQGPSSAPSTPSGTREPTILTAPPAGAEKKRCYRLNLEVPGGIPSVDPSTGQHIFGPLIYEPPAHHLPGGFRKSSS